MRGQRQPVVAAMVARLGPRRGLLLPWSRRLIRPLAALQGHRQKGLALASLPARVPQLSLRQPPTARPASSSGSRPGFNEYY